MADTDLSEFLHSDLMQMRAAEGWLELGDPKSADDELDQVQPKLKAHPAVLQLRWAILCALGKWEAALELATNLTQLAPKEKHGWLHRSFALHELKRTEEARENLRAVLHRFPKFALMHYNLACYECRLGDLHTARELLSKTFRLPQGAELREAALKDSDLKELWPIIKDL